MQCNHHSKRCYCNDNKKKKTVTNIEQTVNTFDLPKKEDLLLFNTKEEDLLLLNTNIKFDDRIQISVSDGWKHHLDKLLSTTTANLANLTDEESITNKYYMPCYYPILLKMFPTITLREKCLNTEFFLVCIFSQNTEKYLNIFHAVLHCGAKYCYFLILNLKIVF